MNKKIIMPKELENDVIYLIIYIIIFLFESFASNIINKLKNIFKLNLIYYY